MYQVWRAELNPFRRTLDDIQDTINALRFENRHLRHDIDALKNKHGNLPNRKSTSSPLGPEKIAFVSQTSESPDISEKVTSSSADSESSTTAPDKEKEETPATVWQRFKGNTTAHGIPHVHNATG
jgi:hypothetical protein